MRWLPKFRSEQHARAQWDAGLAWFRLRYLETEGPTRCLNLLSHPQAAGRVSLYFQPGETVSRLYLGVPETYVRLLKRMMDDFGFSLKSEPLTMNIPAKQRLVAVSKLPWDRVFMAHIVAESAFVNLGKGEPKKGSYLPVPLSPDPNSLNGWRLPVEPPSGVTLQPFWNGHQLPAHFVAIEPDTKSWPLGKTTAGKSVQVCRQINIYGRQEAVADWLVHQVTQIVSRDHTNLVIIDGGGDLVPRLKRKAVVTRLLGEQLAYVDIDSPFSPTGFNPLGIAPGETKEMTLQRWQCWFREMNVHPQGIQLLRRAQQDGVKDIPSLKKWLKKPARQGKVAAVSSLGLALNRLTARHAMREWLEWPTNRYAILPQGALFFACKGISWEREQLLLAVLLAVKQVADVRLIIHGFPWKAFKMSERYLEGQIIVSNGPLLNESVIVLTESHPRNVTTLARQFLGGSERMQENLELLNRGESIVIVGEEVICTSWRQSEPGQNAGIENTI